MRLESDIFVSQRIGVLPLLAEERKILTIKYKRHIKDPNKLYLGSGANYIDLSIIDNIQLVLDSLFGVRHSEILQHIPLGIFDNIDAHVVAVRDSIVLQPPTYDNIEELRWLSLHKVINREYDVDQITLMVAAAASNYLDRQQQLSEPEDNILA